MQSERNIWLKIEALPNYNPVPTRQDVMGHSGHAGGIIPNSEVQDRSIRQALIYREYTEDWKEPVPRKIIESDITEPPVHIPGTVLYAEPGDLLRVHVLNEDPSGESHSFHVHGLEYGIDSDAAWPFGIDEEGGRKRELNRSDAIKHKCSWTYTFRVTERTIGAWPFHDHVKNVQDNIERGLFGGVIVRDPNAPPVDHEAVIFVHALKGQTGTEGYRLDSPLLPPFREGKAEPTFRHTFPSHVHKPIDISYFCRIHSSMVGFIRVDPQSNVQSADVNIRNTRFQVVNPPDPDRPNWVVVGPGAEVIWHQQDTAQHTVTSGGQRSFCLNGRTFLPSTPRIAVKQGARIRWYLLNLDLGMMWHNFHLHGQRWRLGDEVIDVRSLGPAESFVFDTEAPPIALGAVRPQDGVGEFIFHCHVEMHMMDGLVGSLLVAKDDEGVSQLLAGAQTT